MASAVVLVMTMGTTSCMSEWRTKSFLSDGPKITESRQANGFEEIEINGSPRVCYTQADSFSIQIVGTREAVDNILTEVKGKTLTIRNRGKIKILNVSLGNDDGLTVNVTSPDLTAVRLNGSGDFESNRRIDTDRMDIVLRGSGDIDIKDVICDRCEVNLTGSGDISLGNLEAMEASATLIGSGDINLKLQRVQKTLLSLKGSGDIDTEFKEGCGAVDCELRGSGDISLKGTIKRFNHHKSGSGDIDYDRLTVK